MSSSVRVPSSRRGTALSMAIMEPLHAWRSTQTLPSQTLNEVHGPFESWHELTAFMHTA